MEGQKGMPAKGNWPWWYYVLIVLGLVVLGLILWWIIDRLANNYGCVPGKGCVRGEGRLSLGQCQQDCADAGAEVYRCDEAGSCIPLSAGTGLSLAECRKNCVPTFDLKGLVDGARPAEAMTIDRCDTSDDRPFIFFQPDARKRSDYTRVRLTRADGAFDPSNPMYYPLTTPIQLVLINESEPPSNLYLQLDLPQNATPDFRKTNPILQEAEGTSEAINEALAVKLVAGVAESPREGRSWTLNYDTPRDRVTISIAEGGLTYYLYALRPGGTRCPANSFLAMGLPLDPRQLLGSGNRTENMFAEYGFFELQGPD